MKVLFTLPLFFTTMFSFAQPGSLLTSFGNGGKVVTDMGRGAEWINDMVIQNDGKIIMAGPGGVSANANFALARYNPDGTLDNTFNGNGKVRTAISSGSNTVFAITLQPDGKIVAVGNSLTDMFNLDFAIIRYNTDGTLDNTFDRNGIVVTNISTNSGSRLLRFIQ